MMTAMDDLYVGFVVASAPTSDVPISLTMVELNILASPLVTHLSGAEINAFKHIMG
jgi:hypothetical protein